MLQQGKITKNKETLLEKSSPCAMIIYYLMDETIIELYQESSV